MVDVGFERRLAHMVPLALLQHLTSGQLTESQRHDVKYLSDEHIESLRGMALLNRSRLSVQVCGEPTDKKPVHATAYEAICLLGEKGGFEFWPGKWNTETPKHVEKDEGHQREAKRRRT